MTYIVLSFFLGLVALAIAVVPVTVILRREKRAGWASLDHVSPAVAADNQEDWPLAA
jgi:hypothetical protein